MARKLLGVATLAVAALVTAATATAGMNTGGGRKVFLTRIYTSEVPSNVNDIGAFTRIGVILPGKSKIVRVQAYMDVEDYGRNIGKWHECDFETGKCDIGKGRVTGLTRKNSSNDVQIIADFWNDHDSELRYGKLRVTFMPIGNMRTKYEPRECWLRIECGYAGLMDDEFSTLPPPDSPIRIRGEEDEDTGGGSP